MSWQGGQREVFVPFTEAPVTKKQVMSLGDGVMCSYMCLSWRRSKSRFCLSPDYKYHGRLMVPKLCFGLARKDSI